VNRFDVAGARAATAPGVDESAKNQGS